MSIMTFSNSLKMGIVCLGVSAGLALVVSSAPSQAAPGAKGHAHGHAAKADSHGGNGNHSMPGGMPGDRKNVSRTIVIVAKDNEFNLKKIQVKDGETIRFVVKNKGELVHEMTIGTPEMQKEHQAEMIKMMDAGHRHPDEVVGNMGHNHGNSALVEPGQEKEIIWMFHKGATLEFGCNVPGHYESGMKGRFVVQG
jgi:uncharacterized cupredoxin-like copper-binding protein